MVETSVTDRARGQGKRLRVLRERTGISKGRLMDVLGFRTSRAYDLYEDGTSVIRLDRLADWAAAFGLSVPDFVASIVLGIDPVLRERVIDALGPEAERRPPEYIDEVTQRLSEQDKDVREDALRELHEDTHAGVSASC